MAGKQKDALEAKARSSLAEGPGAERFTVVDPGRVRPSHARLEIVHPRLADRQPREWHDLMQQMLEDGTAAAVVTDLAGWTRQLRDHGIRATADYRLGTIVVSWGKVQDVSRDEIRQDLARRAAGEPVPEENVEIAWSGRPASEVDALTPALQNAMRVIAPGHRPGGPARPSRQQQRPRPPATGRR